VKLEESPFRLTFLVAKSNLKKFGKLVEDAAPGLWFSNLNSRFFLQLAGYQVYVGIVNCKGALLKT
jgi:hypothetical protein